MSIEAFDEEEMSSFEQVHEVGEDLEGPEFETLSKEINPTIGHRASEKDAGALVERYSALISFFAKRYLRGVVNPVITEEDLYQAGVMGLFEADERFDPSIGSNKTTYLITRSKGAMIDQLREHMPVSRGEAKILRQRREAEDKLSQDHLRTPKENEIAALLDMDESDLSRKTDGAHDKQFPVELDAFVQIPGEEDTTVTYSDMLSSNIALTADGIEERADIYDALQRAGLTEKEARVILRHVIEEYFLSDVGEELGVSESRAYQHKKSGLKKIRSQLEEHHRIAA